MRKITSLLLLLITGAGSIFGASLSSGDVEICDSVLTVRRGVKEIPAYAFRDRKDLAEVRFERGSVLASIGDYAFIGCENLRKVELPGSLRILGEGAFRECRRLESIDLPSGLRKLPAYLFYWCEGLRRVSLPRGLETIGRGCFGYCRSLEEAQLPEGLKNIGSNAFSCCGALEEIKVPSSVTELESYAFSDCLSLRKIVFPANSSLLGELILSGCAALEEIYEYSPRPPKFDCESFLFEPDEEGLYKSVTLYVGAGKGAAYRRAHGWGMVDNIVER